MAKTEALQDSRPRDADLSTQIRDAILTGRYVPGQRMVEVDLCEQFGVSRFMVRAALKQLAGEGLIEMRHNKGARVRSVPLEDAIDIVEVRMALEGISAARAAVNATDDDIRQLQGVMEEMREAVRRGDLTTYMHTNIEFHRAIQTISANQACTQILERLRATVVRHQFTLSTQPLYPSIPVAQHEEIMQAIVTHNPEKAEAAMRDHIATIIRAMREEKTYLLR